MNIGTGTGSELAKNSMHNLGNWAVRHLPTIGLVLGAIWFIGKPHMEGFITETVAGSFKEQETLIFNNTNAINNLSTEQRANTTELGNVKSAVDALTKASNASKESTDELKILLRQKLSEPQR